MKINELLNLLNKFNTEGYITYENYKQLYDISKAKEHVLLYTCSFETVKALYLEGSIKETTYKIKLLELKLTLLGKQECAKLLNTVNNELSIL